MKKKKFTVDKMTFVAFTIIPLILYTFFYFISVSCGIYYSLTDWNGLNREYNFVGIANYIALSKNVFMWRSLWRTLLYACMLVVCVTVLSLIIALVLNSVKKCRVFVKSVFFLPGNAWFRGSCINLGSDVLSAASCSGENDGSESSDTSCRSFYSNFRSIVCKRVAGSSDAYYYSAGRTSINTG